MEYFDSREFSPEPESRNQSNFLKFVFEKREINQLESNLAELNESQLAGYLRETEQTIAEVLGSLKFAEEGKMKHEAIEKDSYPGEKEKSLELDLRNINQLNEELALFRRIEKATKDELEKRGRNKKK